MINNIEEKIAAVEAEIDAINEQLKAKKDELGENITVVEGQSGRYANSTFKYITTEYKIRFAYENGHEALRGLSLRVREGELTAIVGTNGAGKTTLFKMIADAKVA